LATQPAHAVAAHLRGILAILARIRQTEGLSALWKGLGPNLVGVVPARAIYFSVYSQAKHKLTKLNKNKETWKVHMTAAATAGFAVASFTNPIWLQTLTKGW
jgi:solute carrier family 25 protein 33/36